MKNKEEVKGDLYQYDQQVGKHLYQYDQLVDGDLFQVGHYVGGNLSVYVMDDSKMKDLRDDKIYEYQLTKDKCIKFI